MPGTALSALLVVTHLISTITLPGRRYYYPHFADKETELGVVKQLVQGLMIGKLEVEIGSSSRNEDLTPALKGHAAE